MVPQEGLRAQLGGDVQRGRRRQQLALPPRRQLVTFEPVGVHLRQEVGADVPGDEAGVGDDLPQEGDVVGHTWGGEGGREREGDREGGRQRGRERDR